MKPTLAQLAAVATAAGIGACGGSGTATQSASRSGATLGPATTQGAAVATTLDRTRGDGDKDNDAGTNDDTNNNRDLHYGHAASATDRRLVTELVKRYYAAAFLENGAEACGLIYSLLAESVPEDYGSDNQPPGPSYMRGTTCRASLGGLFRHMHAQLVVELPKLRVTAVRLIRHTGLALLSFGTMPQREIAVTREGRVWRMAALFDRELP